MDDASLAALIKNIQAGEQAALARLYDYSVGRVYKLARRITGNHADAEEVTCDVYQQIWRTATLFDPTRGLPWQWIMAIARSRALDRCRRTRAARDLLRSEAREPLATEPDAGSDSTLDNLETQTQITAALERLTSTQLKLIRLAFYEDLTHREIAAHMQLPLGTIKSSIRRALQLLRRALAAEVTDAALRPAEDFHPPRTEKKLPGVGAKRIQT